MKKFMKVCSILALILVTLGMSMVVIVIAVRGPVVLSQLGSYLSTLDYGAYFEPKVEISFNPNSDILKGDITQDFDADAVQNLIVEAGACQLAIEQSPDGEFHVEVEHADKYQGFVAGDSLCLNMVGNTKSYDEDSVGRICLYVPEQFSFKEAKISLGAGQINGKTDLQVKDMEIALGAGEIRLSALTVEKLQAQVGAGSLIFKGDIGQKADVECAMGNVEMTLNGSKNDYNYEVEAAAGDVNVGGQSFGGLAGKWGIENDAPRDIDVECAMGSVFIKFAE